MKDNNIIKTLHSLLPTIEVKMEKDSTYTIYENGGRTATQNMSEEFMTDLIKKLERDKETEDVLTKLKEWGEVDEASNHYYIEVENVIYKANKADLERLKEILDKVTTLPTYNRKVDTLVNEMREIVYPFIMERKYIEINYGEEKLALTHKEGDWHINVNFEDGKIVDFPNLDPYIMGIITDQIIDLIEHFGY